MERFMRIRCLVAFVLVIAAIAPVRAEVRIVADPDKWIEQALADISQGKTDDFARNYLALIDKPDSFDSFAGNLRVLSRLGAPVFMENVVDVKFGTALREVVYLALYHRTDYVYFRFTIKKNSGGWLISDFRLQERGLGLVSEGFRHAQVTSVGSIKPTHRTAMLQLISARLRATT
jgi:hypothetical protein